MDIAQCQSHEQDIHGLIMNQLARFTCLAVEVCVKILNLFIAHLMTIFTITTFGLSISVPYHSFCFFENRLNSDY